MGRNLGREAVSRHGVPRLAAAPANPRGSPMTLSDPSAHADVDADADADFSSSTDGTTYHWLCRRPLVARDVEDARLGVVEVVVRWGDCVLEVAHVEPGATFVLDDERGHAVPVVLHR